LQGDPFFLCARHERQLGGKSFAMGLVVGT